jgi:large subunit ribosomal protein L18
MIEKQDKNLARLKRHRRVRAKLFGTSDRPRLGVFRSQKHIYAQLIDDAQGVTLASASSLDPEIRGAESVTGSTAEGARQVGQLIAKRALAKGIEEVVFDRGGYIYHGRVAAVADAAREAGLRF